MRLGLLISRTCFGLERTCITSDKPLDASPEIFTSGFENNSSCGDNRVMTNQNLVKNSNFIKKNNSMGIPILQNGQKKFGNCNEKIKMYWADDIFELNIEDGRDSNQSSDISDFIDSNNRSNNNEKNNDKNNIGKKNFSDNDYCDEDHINEEKKGKIPFQKNSDNSTNNTKNENNFCFTDGCGFVSLNVALNLPSKVSQGIKSENTEKYHNFKNGKKGKNGANVNICAEMKTDLINVPCAFQVRIFCPLGIFKGVLVVDKNLPDDVIIVRKSMQKVFGSISSNVYDFSADDYIGVGDKSNSGDHHLDKNTDMNSDTNSSYHNVNDNNKSNDENEKKNCNYHNVNDNDKSNDENEKSHCNKSHNQDKSNKNNGDNDICCDIKKSNQDKKFVSYADFVQNQKNNTSENNNKKHKKNDTKKSFLSTKSISITSSFPTSSSSSSTASFSPMISSNLSTVCVEVVNTSRSLGQPQFRLNKHLILLLHHRGVPYQYFENILRSVH